MWIHRNSLPLPAPRYSDVSYSTKQSVEITNERFSSGNKTNWSWHAGIVGRLNFKQNSFVIQTGSRRSSANTIDSWVKGDTNDKWRMFICKQSYRSKIMPEMTIPTAERRPNAFTEPFRGWKTIKESIRIYSDTIYSRWILWFQAAETIFRLLTVGLYLRSTVNLILGEDDGSVGNVFHLIRDQTPDGVSFKWMGIRLKWSSLMDGRAELQFLAGSFVITTFVNVFGIEICICK